MITYFLISIQITFAKQLVQPVFSYESFKFTWTERGKYESKYLLKFSAEKSKTFESWAKLLS